MIVHEARRNVGLTALLIMLASACSEPTAVSVISAGTGPLAHASAKPIPGGGSGCLGKVCYDIADGTVLTLSSSGARIAGGTKIKADVEIRGTLETAGRRFSDGAVVLTFTGATFTAQRAKSSSQTGWTFARIVPTDLEVTLDMGPGEEGLRITAAGLGGQFSLSPSAARFGGEAWGFGGDEWENRFGGDEWDIRQGFGGDEWDRGNHFGGDEWDIRLNFASGVLHDRTNGLVSASALPAVGMTFPSGTVAITSDDDWEAAVSQIEFAAGGVVRDIVTVKTVVKKVQTAPGR
jgi:hypothetical protein